MTVSRIVQVEQLDERGFPAQTGRKARIIAHLTSHGFALHSNYTVAERDTEDLIFVRDGEMAASSHGGQLGHTVSKASSRAVADGAAQRRSGAARASALTRRHGRSSRAIGTQGTALV